MALSCSRVDDTVAPLIHGNTDKGNHLDTGPGMHGIGRVCPQLDPYVPNVDMARSHMRAVGNAANPGMCVHRRTDANRAEYHTGTRVS